METKARVVEVDKVSRIAVVETRRQAACDGCHKQTEGDGCSVCSLMGAGDPCIRTKARNEVGAEVGDRVEIASGNGRMLLYAALVFILPIVTGLLGYFLGKTVFSQVGWQYACAVAGFFVTLLGVGLYSRWVISRRVDAVIVRVLPETPADGEHD